MLHKPKAPAFRKGGAGTTIKRTLNVSHVRNSFHLWLMVFHPDAKVRTFSSGDNTDLWGFLRPAYPYLWFIYIKRPVRT